MRTTLDLDEDVLLAVKEIAALTQTTAGKVLSDLARQALRPDASSLTVRNGVPLLPQRPDERPVSMELVNRLRDQRRPTVITKPSATTIAKAEQKRHE